MAAYTIPAPGTELGPCIDDPCGHVDCEEARRRAELLCDVCQQPIGFETRHFTFYEDDGTEDGACNDTESVRHARCDTRGVQPPCR